MADSKARAEQINLPSCCAFMPSGITVGSQGGSCRFRLGCLARCKNTTPHLNLTPPFFLQQDHKSFKTTLIAAQLSGLERSGSYPIESSRIPGAPTYQGGPSPSSRRCLYFRSSVLAFCRFSGLYNIFRCHNCQVPQHLMQLNFHCIVLVHVRRFLSP